MPIYEVQHSIPLTISQQDELAAAITNLHSSTFTTPKLFVQLFFTDISQRIMYVGGKRNNSNHIRGYVRTGPSRTQADWDNHCKNIAAAWEEICRTPLPTTKGAAKVVTERDTELRSVIIMGDMVAGLEVGVLLPRAGEDVGWLDKNMGYFESLAEQGDEEMRDLVKEVRERGLVADSNGYHKAMMQKLEEMLGWGDSA